MKSSKILNKQVAAFEIKRAASIGIKCAAAAAIALAGLTGCSSLQQDVVISTIPTEEQNEISNYEFRLVYLDAAWSVNSKEYLSSEELKEKNNACNALLKDVRKSLSKTNLVNATLARLHAIEGRILLIQGDKTKAGASYKISTDLYNGDIQQLILGHRLGILTDLSIFNFAKADKPLILVEQAIDFYKEKKYADAVAKFDEAFISSESFYYDAYKEFRAECWNYRFVNEEDTLSTYLTIKKLNIGQMMLITQEYRDVIEFYIGDSFLTETNLYRKLSQKGTITSAVKEKPSSKLNISTAVTRKLQARYLWNLYCDVKNKHKIKNRYSNAYIDSGRESPVKDVNTDDEDFDAILGCIEYNLMNLTDGINFNPDSLVSGLEFNESIKKLNNKL